MKYRVVNGDELGAYQERLANFEAQFRYPLGDGRFFRISHGADYGAFFRSLGTPKYLVVENDAGEIVAFTAASRRTIALPGGRGQDMWYLCDFKIAKPYRGGRTFMGMGSRMLPRFYRYWIGAYFVAMNKQTLSELLAERELQTGGIATLIPKRGFPVFKPVSLQAIYFVPPLATTVTGAEDERVPLGAQAWRQTIHEPAGSYVLTSNRGIKDILLEPAWTPMSLLHAGTFRHAPDQDPAKALVELVTSARARTAALGFETLCFCWDAHDVPVRQALAEVGLTTEASGTVYDLYPPATQRLPLPVQTAHI